MTSTNSGYMRKYRQTPQGRMQMRVHSRANSRALSAFKAEFPERWREILDQAWFEVTGGPPGPNGRPPKPLDDDDDDEELAS